MKTCYLVGGGEFDGFFDKIDESDFVIGVDKGYKNLLKVGIEPDLIIGDFDSSEEPDFGQKIKLNPEKDMTDTYAGIDIGIKNGYEKFIVYGGLGGRLSHTLANIKIAEEFKSKGIDIVFKSKKQRLFLVKDYFFYKFNKKKNFYVSIFSLRDKSKGVTLEGLKYPLKNFDLNYDNHMGVSNETTGKDFKISLKDGLLLVIFENKDIN
ncbi:MAG: thiamine diphosphokinase [Anaerococcus sp.]